MDAPAPPRTPSAQSGPGIWETFGRVFYGDRWDTQHQQAQEILQAQAAHAAELRRLELVKARAEATQATLIAIAIGGAAVLIAVLLTVIIVQVAGL